MASGPLSPSTAAQTNTGESMDRGKGLRERRKKKGDKEEKEKKKEEVMRNATKSTRNGGGKKGWLAQANGVTAREMKKRGMEGGVEEKRQGGRVEGFSESPGTPLPAVSHTRSTLQPPRTSVSTPAALPQGRLGGAHVIPSGPRRPLSLTPFTLLSSPRSNTHIHTLRNAQTKLTHS